MVTKFIDTMIGKMAWFATPAGIFRGKVSNNINNDTFTLEAGYYFTGNISLLIGEITIITKNVVAWGEMKPVFNNIFD